MYVYNHNFFVLDGAPTGKATVITLPFKPQGHWRDEYDSVALTDNGIRFSRDLRPGETIFMGDLKGSEQRKNYSFRLANTANGLTVMPVRTPRWNTPCFGATTKSHASNPIPTSSSSPAARRNGR